MLRFGEEECVIVVPDGDEPVREFTLGERVHFTFHAERIHLFSCETEHNLEHDPDEAIATGVAPARRRTLPRRTPDGGGTGGSHEDP